MPDLELRLRGSVETSGIPEVGIGFHDFRSGKGFLIDGQRVFHAASMMKVPVICEAFRRDLLDSQVEVNNSFASIVDGSPYSLDPEDDSEKTLYARIGAKEPVRSLVELMITESSNLATNILVELLGAERVSAFMAELGAEGMVVRRGVEDGKAYAQGLNNTATAQAYLSLMVSLGRGKVVSPVASEEMIQVLLRQRHNEAIPAGLPPGTQVAHKTGWNTDCYHDGGLILSSEGALMAVAVFTKGAESMEQAHEFVASVAAECWRAVSD